jgi:hypothetical protein
MARYYFDTWDNDHFIEDDAGVELASLDLVKDQAALSLAELAHETLPGKIKHTLRVVVRNDTQPILRASLIFEAIILTE